MRLLTHPLYASWKPGRPFIVMANVGLYFALNGVPLVPDTLVSLDVTPPDDFKPKEHRAYFTWIYGKPPDIAIEIVSNKEGGELDRKLRIYAHHRVPYYVVFDPQRQIQKKKLRCFELRGAGEYREMKGTSFSSTGLGLVEWDGKFETVEEHWIRWVDENGKLIPTGEERASTEARRAATARRQAKVEATRAELADSKAALAARRAEALAAKLRELGIDPDSVET
jgi:Uma2 family endonuclease